MPLEQAVSTDKAAEREQTLHISSQEVKEISSELALVRSAESIFAYLVKIGDWHRLIAMSRAMRWASITLPHNQDGRTQVLPPRESVVKEVQGAIVSDSPQEKIAQLELFYMEPGCQFFFDLQKHEADLTKAMGRADISKQIERQLRLLVEREPQILRLSYCDGTPFASERTRRWISAPPANALSKPKRQPEERDLQSMLNKIYSQVNPLDLLASIDQIDRIAANNDSEEFLLRLAKLEVCMKANRDDLALPLAEHLENDVVQYKLHKWDKSLALQVWDNLLVLLQKTDHKAQLELQRIDELKRKICTTDLGFALRTW
jgi:type VI secretion system protein VasJ